MAIKFVAIRMGDGRTTAVSQMVLSAHREYATPQDALDDLANAFFLCFLETKFRLNSCCTTADPAHLYCPRCGTALRPTPPQLYDFIPWVMDFNFKLSDDFEVDLKGWSPWEPISVLLDAAKREEVFCLNSQGEELLACAVNFSKIDHPIARAMAQSKSWKEETSEIYILNDYRAFVPLYSYIDES